MTDAIESKEPATKQDLDRAIDGLKIYIVERESAWIKWVMGVQITYFVLTLGVVYFALSHIK